VPCSTRSTALRRRFVRRAALLVVLLALAGCGGGSSEKAAAPADGVQELANVLQLRSDFETDAGKTRLLLLFSPT
jgi:ABC-type glycerol-3-phosphate transport system substrate-binding protein